MSKPLYTVGYQGLALSRLVEIVSKLDALLVDVRSAPFSSRSRFSLASLRKAFGNRYIWRGRDLGDKAPVTQHGIDWLRRERKERTLLLMCMERAPGDCHRHHAICAPYFPDALHICGDELIEARELDRSIRDSGEYTIHGSLAELLR